MPKNKSITKIIYIITRIDRGGSSENLIDMCNRLYDDNFDLVLIYGGETLRNFKFKSYYIKDMKREISFKNEFKALVKIFRILKEEKPDIVHTHTSKAGILGRWASFIYKIFYNIKLRIIHIPRGHIFYGYFGFIKTKFFIFLEILTSFITNRFIALTENEKKENIESGVGNEKKWVVIPSGIDYKISLSGRDIKKEFNIKPDEIVIGTCARLEPVKGIEYFVRSYKYLKNILKIKGINLNFYYLVVGDGSEFGYLKEICKEDGTINNIIFTGWRDDVYDLINIMDIYVQPSLNEGMGRSVVIAELLSKPIIASSVCGLKDLIIDGYNGYLAEPKNSLELAMKIYLLLSDKNKIQDYGRNSFEFVNRKVDGFKFYSFDREYFLLKKLYQS